MHCFGVNHTYFSFGVSCYVMGFILKIKAYWHDKIVLNPNGNTFCILSLKQKVELLYEIMSKKELLSFLALIFSLYFLSPWCTLSTIIRGFFVVVVSFIFGSFGLFRM